MCHRLFVNAPLSKLSQALDIFPGLGVGPEIYTPAPDLQRYGDPAAVMPLVERLSDLQLPCTMHGPFIDLSPGGFDSQVVEATRVRFRQALRLAKELQPRVVVFHSGYDRWKYALNMSMWLENSRRFWEPLVEEAEKIDTYIAVENIFETSPIGLKMLMDAVDSPRFGCCFDIGHWNLFGTVDLNEWLSLLGERIISFHLHDNRGSFDAHLVPGDGLIDFATFKRDMEELEINPRAYTFEPHNPADVARGVAWFREIYGL
jgi:sugar phosphate isomerase/epimerase